MLVVIPNYVVINVILLTTYSSFLNRHMISSSHSVFVYLMTVMCFTSTGDAADVGAGRCDLRRLFRRHPLHGADQPPLRATTHSSARHRPYLPRPHIFLQGIRQERRTIPRVRAHLLDFFSVCSYW